MRKYMADFVIRIPRVSVAVAEAELTGLLVEPASMSRRARRST